MRCEECLALLEEHADGETSARDAARVEAHLEACAACARERRTLEEERAVFLSYECDAAPAPNFWTDVLSKIEAEAGAAPSSSPFARHDSKAAGVRARLGAALGLFSAPRLSPALVAALLVVAVGATVSVMKYAGDAGGGRSAPPSSSGGAGVAARNEDESAAGRNEAGAGELKTAEKSAAVEGRREVAEARARDEEKSVRRSAEKSVRVKNARAAVSPEGSTAPDRLVREAEQKYLAAIRLLARDVNGRHARLDADARARFERTLADVDRTIADTRRAAREHPRDPVAVQYMLTAYARKVELLREMARN